MTLLDIEEYQGVRMLIGKLHNLACNSCYKIEDEFFAGGNKFCCSKISLLTTANNLPHMQTSVTK